MGLHAYVVFGILYTVVTIPYSRLPLPMTIRSAQSCRLGAWVAPLWCRGGNRSSAELVPCLRLRQMVTKR